MACFGRVNRGKSLLNLNVFQILLPVQHVGRLLTPTACCHCPLTPLWSFCRSWTRLKCISQGSGVSVGHWSVSTCLAPINARATFVFRRAYARKTITDTIWQAWKIYDGYNNLSTSLEVTVSSNHRRVPFFCPLLARLLPLSPHTEAATGTEIPLADRGKRSPDFFFEDQKLR